MTNKNKIYRLIKFSKYISDIIDEIPSKENDLLTLENAFELLSIEPIMVSKLMKGKCFFKQVLRVRITAIIMNNGHKWYELLNLEKEDAKKIKKYLKDINMW